MGSPATAIRQEKEDIQIEREKVKLSLFTDYMILYKKNPKDIKKLLINKFSKVSGYKINI